MLSLKKYREYWESIGKLCGIDTVSAITVDKEMTKRIQSLPKNSYALFWLPPAAKSEGSSADSFREQNSCILFIMEKYDPMRESAVMVLERTQQMVETVKEQLIKDSWRSCNPIPIDLSSLDTLPETEFYGSLAGWSIGFKIRTDYLSHE